MVCRSLPVRRISCRVCTIILGRKSGRPRRSCSKHLDREGIPLRLVTGADNHIVPSFVAELRSGHLLSLADTRYVLVEPPHHVAPPRLEDCFSVYWWRAMCRSSPIRSG